MELFTKERAMTSDLRGKMGIEEFVMDRQRLGTTHKPLLSLELTSSDIDVSGRVLFYCPRPSPFLTPLLQPPLTPTDLHDSRACRAYQQDKTRTPE